MQNDSRAKRSAVMPGHSRLKDGVLRTPMCRASTPWGHAPRKTWMAGTSGAKTSLRAFCPTMTVRERPAFGQNMIFCFLNN
jgi:hypothetical protein